MVVNPIRIELFVKTFDFLFSLTYDVLNFPVSLMFIDKSIKDSHTRSQSKL